MALTPARDRDGGLTSLLADVLRAEASDDELLVRYADDPATLDAEDRTRIERALEGSPALRDQLRVLRQFDLNAAVATRVEQRPMPRPSAPLRRRLVILAIPLAAAALLVIALLRSGGPELRPPAATPPGPIAQAEPPAPSKLPTPVEPELPRAQPEAKPVEIAKAPPPAKPKLAPTPKAEAAPPTPELDYVAMAEPVYRAPFGAPALEGGGTYLRGAGAGVALSALAPRHVARTVSARPTLFWYLSALPEGEPAYLLTIAGDDDVEPLVQAPIPAPTSPGLQRVALAADLPVGRPLRWSIAVRLDPENPSRDVIASGGIERTPESPDLTASLAAAKPLDRGSVYAAAGFWYDALAELERVARDAPDHAVPRARLQSLLESAGIPDAERLAR